MHTFAAPLPSSKLQQMGTQIGSSPYFGHVLPAMKRPGVMHGRAQRVKTLTTAATSGGPNGSPDASESSAKSRTRAKEDVASLREKLNNYIEKKAGYFWLGGPLVTTAAVVIPPALISIVDLLQKNWWLGLVATFGLDVLFVLAADLFFVLSDKAGHQQAIAGGPPPWIGPWEYTGYPKGEPTLTKYISYAGVAIGLLGLVTSLFLGKLAVGLPALGSYLALIFIQVSLTDSPTMISVDFSCYWPMVLTSFCNDCGMLVVLCIYCGSLSLTLNVLRNISNM